MKPTIKIAATKTPDGNDMVLCQHDRDFLIKVNHVELMNSRQHESELELARLGCGHLKDKEAPHILIGGLGLGYTLRETLAILSPQAHIVVGELMGAVVEWNRNYLKDLNGHALEDNRVEIHTGNVVELILRSKIKYDAILLDIDNGPHALADKGNQRLYSLEGIKACRQALSHNGCLAVWSTAPSKKFEQRLVKNHFHVRRYRVPAYKGSKSMSCFIWLASHDETILPPGGGKPRL